MNENIPAAIVRPNKAEASIILETDNNTLCHFFRSLLFRFVFQVLGWAARKAVNAAQR